MIFVQQYKMNNSAAYQAWIDLFNDSLHKIWDNELNEDLRPLSMLLTSIKFEMKRIQNNLDDSVLKLRNKQYKYLNSTTGPGKENADSEKTESFEVFEQDDPTLTSDNSELTPSGDISLQNDSISLVISDDDLVNTGILGDNLASSPELKKRKRFNFSKKYRQIRHTRTAYSCTLSPNVLKNLLKKDDLKNPNSQSIVINDASSLDILKPLNFLTKINNVESIPKPCQDSGTPEALSHLSFDDIDNSSIVQCTPTNTKIMNSKRKEKLSYLSKKKVKGEKGSTITQMFMKNFEDERKRIPKKSCKELNPIMNDNEPNKADSSLTELVDYMNENIDSENIDKARLEIVDLDSSSNESGCQPLQTNSGKCNIKSEDFNVMLAKAQNIPQKLHDFQPVVRGKARKQLPGWSCKDCEKFYQNQGLTPKEMVALSNKCSKHRGYAPREDTIPGFWDMDIWSQESRNQDK